jgi:hypothetical protein
VTNEDRRLLEAQQFLYREELAKQQMQLLTYRQCLLDNGIEPPDRSGEELLVMWRNCRKLMEVANWFVSELGSTKELLQEPWR